MSDYHVSHLRAARVRRRRHRRFAACVLCASLCAFALLLGARLLGQPGGFTASHDPNAVTDGAAVSAPDTADKPEIILVNPWNPLPEDYEADLVELQNGQAVDKSCYPDLQQMMDDCRAAGLSPLICSSYRSQQKQEELFQNKISRLIAEGYTREQAETEAAKAVAVPGTSEHQLGLAVDIVDVTYQLLDEAQERTHVQQWLIEHSWEYGFILRYPSDKSDVTGIIYEPWHYRFVGKETAREIKEQGVCLEEYLGVQNA